MKINYSNTGNSRIFIHDLVDNIANQYSEHTAVIFGQKTLSYKDLNEASNKLAERIKAIAGNHPIIGICLLYTSLQRFF